jgi:hypothetical protein
METNIPKEARPTPRGGGGGYTASSASDANFGEEEFRINLDDEEPIQEEQLTPESRPMGRDRAKAQAKAQRGKGASSSSAIEEYMSTMITNINNTAVQKQQVLKTYEDSIKSVSLAEHERVVIEYKKLRYMDTSHMSKKKRANQKTYLAHLRAKFNIEDSGSDSDSE